MQFFLSNYAISVYLHQASLPPFVLELPLPSLILERLLHHLNTNINM